MRSMLCYVWILFMMRRYVDVVCLYPYYTITTAAIATTCVVLSSCSKIRRVY